MRAAPENYKGIEYVQISSLPAEQREMIMRSIHHKLIITILKEETLLHDCLQYQHYNTWYDHVFTSALREKTVEVKMSSPALALAFK
jgi:hypothetical protein